jgi:hypothetical protein
LANAKNEQLQLSDINQAMVVVLTADELLRKGLELVGFDHHRQQMYVERPTCTASGDTTGQIPLSMHRFGKICPSFKQQRQQMKIPGRWTLICFIWLSVF